MIAMVLLDVLPTGTLNKQCLLFLSIKTVPKGSLRMAGADILMDSLSSRDPSASTTSSLMLRNSAARPKSYSGTSSSKALEFIENVIHT